MRQDFENEPIGHVDAKEIEPLYWTLEDALFDGNRKRATACFNLLACIAKQKSTLLRTSLKEGQLNRLQEIAHELYGSSTYVRRKPVDIRPALSSTPIPFAKELELKNFLASRPEILSRALGETVRVVGTEVKTDFDYACDIVAESEHTYYPVELKIRQATHGAVAQIQKYCFYFYRKLRYDHYKRIQGVVCSNGFDDFAINELRRNGIRIFDVVGKGDGIDLVEIS